MPQPCRQLRHEHDEFGVPLAGTGKNSNPFGFTGYQVDEVAGLYYAQARYYDAGLGRFGAVDIHWNADNRIYGNNPQEFIGKVIPKITEMKQAGDLYVYCLANPILYTDKTRDWAGVDDLIAAGVGAVVGVGGQFVSDIITSAVNGDWVFSTWESYVGAGVGGAAGGVVFLYTGPVGAGAVVGGATTLTTRLLRIASEKDELDIIGILLDTAFDTGIGALLGKIPIIVDGITAGRNSFSAVFKSILTRIGNGNAARMAIKTMLKGFVANSINSIPMDIYYGIKGTKLYEGVLAGLKNLCSFFVDSCPD